MKFLGNVFDNGIFPSSKVTYFDITKQSHSATGVYPTHLFLLPLQGEAELTSREAIDGKTLKPFTTMRVTGKTQGYIASLEGPFRFSLVEVETGVVISSQTINIAYTDARDFDLTLPNNIGGLVDENNTYKIVLYSQCSGSANYTTIYKIEFIK